MGRAALVPIVVLAAAIFAAAELLSPGYSRSPAHDRFFGVGLSQPARNGELAAMRRGGVRTVRVVFDWRLVQRRSGGPFHWGAADRSVADAARHDIAVFPQLIATPRWLASDFTRAPSFSRPALRQWRRFVAAAVDRYGRGGSFWTANRSVPYRPISAWEVWNEENSPGFWSPVPSPPAYARLLRASASAIRGADPAADVVLGGMFQSRGTGGAILSWRFLDRLYRLGSAADFDVVAVHPYSPTLRGFRYQLDRIRTTMRRHHDPSPIWIDEIGWASARHGTGYAKGPAGQARMLRRALDFAHGHREELGIGRVMWYPWRDSAAANASCALCQSSGLRTRSGRAKPAWRAYERIAG